MTELELEELLRRWGFAYGEGRPHEWDEGELAIGGALHPLAVAVQFAPGRKQKLTSAAWRRSSNAAGRTPFSDPVRATPTRSVSPTFSRRNKDPEAARVESAAMALQRLYPLRGLVIRAQYCRRGTQAEKADWVSAVGQAVTLRTYRQELALARAWMLGRLGHGKDD